jgi:monofunctional biosynthetic peptidoglycan transglycosylase
MAPRPLVRWFRRALFAAVIIFMLPIVLSALYRVVPPPGTPLMVIRMIEGDGAARTWVALDDLPIHVPLAVLAAEDNHFCQHNGIDWDAIGDAIGEAQAGKGLRGASTVSMQLTRNLYLWPGGGFFRKGLEGFWTMPADLLLGKPRVMELYLNIAETGRGIFGIEEAAQRYFGKGARDLTRMQAAAIAAILPNPREWSPGRGYAGERTPVLLRRMQDIEPLAGCAWR